MDSVQQDFPLAARLYCEAANSKLPEAQHNWATIRSNIGGLPENCVEAALWLAQFGFHAIVNRSGTIESDLRGSLGRTD